MLLMYELLIDKIIDSRFFLKPVSIPGLIETASIFTGVDFQMIIGDHPECFDRLQKVITNEINNRRIFIQIKIFV